MVEVNNFISDLLDEMLTKDGNRLFLEAGHRPRMVVNGAINAVEGSVAIDQDELVYDLEAFGIVGIAGQGLGGRCVFTYTPDGTNERIKFEAFYRTRLGRLHFDIVVKEETW